MRSGTERTAGNTSASQLPAYLVEKHNKLKEFREVGYGPHDHNMDMAVKKTKAFCADLRLCTETVEGCVLALGVPTAYELIQRMDEVCTGMEAIYNLWKTVSTARKEENRLHDELFDASCGTYASMKEKNDQLEKELRSINAYHDRKDAALDNAIQYVHAVVMDRAAWQEQHGYNRQELGIEEVSFSGRCTMALNALYDARRVREDLNRRLNHNTSVSAEGATSMEESMTGGGSKQRQLHTSISLGSPNYATGEGVSQRPSLVPVTMPAIMHEGQKTPIGRPCISLSDDAATLSRRWRRIADSRHSAVVPSARLKYIPPAEEVELLREVLDMGTGSTVLLKDVESASQKLRDVQGKVREECTALKTIIKDVRHALIEMRWFLRDLGEHRAPFIVWERDLLKLLTEHVESQAMVFSKMWAKPSAEQGGDGGGGACGSAGGRMEDQVTRYDQDDRDEVHTLSKTTSLRDSTGSNVTGMRGSPSVPVEAALSDSVKAEKV